MPTDPKAHPSAANTSATPVAHSALLTVDATHQDDALALHIQHATDHTPVRSNDVQVSIDGGKSQALTLQPDGSYLLADKELSGSATRTLDIIVGHDGIREVLTGSVAVPDTSSAASLLQDHKQMAWWVLIVAIVLIAAIALSRRKSSSSED